LGSLNATGTNMLLMQGSVTASSALGRGIGMDTTLVAAANNDVLVGVDINPTFTNGAFTGVSNIGLRVTGAINNTGQIKSTFDGGPIFLALRTTDAGDARFQAQITSGANAGNFQFGFGGSAGVFGSGVAGGFAGTGTNHTFYFGTNNVAKMALFTTGNLTIQNGGTITDAGYRLDVSGSTRLNGTATIKSASLDYQQNLAVATGSFQTITSVATGSFRSAFFDYVAFSGSIVRAGTIVSTWSGSVTEFYENFTEDLGGSTSVVNLRTAISASNIVLQAGISGSAWSVRSLVRLL